MRIDIQSSEDQFLIYRAPSHVAAYCCGLAVLSAIFGTTFLIIADGKPFPLLLGAVFVIVSFCLFISGLKYLSKKMEIRHSAVLQADQNGLTLAPELNLHATFYKWDEVAEVVLAKQLTTKDSNEKNYCKNQLLIYLQPSDACRNHGLLEGAGYWRSPTGTNMCAVAFPEKQMTRVQQELTRFAQQKAEIRVAKEAVFDFEEGTETLLPA